MPGGYVKGSRNTVSLAGKCSGARNNDSNGGGCVRKELEQDSGLWDVHVGSCGSKGFVCGGSQDIWASRCNAAEAADHEGETGGDGEASSQAAGECVSSIMEVNDSKKDECELEDEHMSMDKLKRDGGGE